MSSPRARLLVIAIASALAAACSSTPRTVARNGANSVGAAMLRQDNGQFIVVTVANPTEAIATLAGSTPRGYDGPIAYRASSTARSTVAALARDYSLQEIAAWPISALGVHCVVFRVSETDRRETTLQRLSHDSRVRLAQPLQTFSTSNVAYNDPYVKLQHGFQSMSLASAHQWSRGDGVRVAVIDTGIDATHPDLQGRVVRQENFVDGDAEQFHRDRHGTGVAGVIAATGNNSQGIVGVAPGVKIVALKACWQLLPTADDARCNSFTLAQALSAALDANAQVVNLSVSGPADPLLDQLIEQGVRRGRIFVGAAPQDGSPNSFPVSNPAVLAVDAAERPSGFRDALPAPGVDILTLTPEGRYDFASGASLATAHVTGAVALLLNQNRKLDANAVRSLLQRSYNGNNVSPVNACNALAALITHSGCPVSD